MNIFSVLFWSVWFVYAASLVQQHRDSRRLKKLQKEEGNKSCANCKFYKGCRHLHQLIELGHPLPLYCDAFEPKDKAKPG